MDHLDIEKRFKIEDEEDADLVIKKPGFLSSEPRFKERYKGRISIFLNIFFRNKS